MIRNSIEIDCPLLGGRHLEIVMGKQDAVDCRHEALSLAIAAGANHRDVVDLARKFLDFMTQASVIERSQDSPAAAQERESGKVPFTGTLDNLRLTVTGTFRDGKMIHYQVDKANYTAWCRPDNPKSWLVLHEAEANRELARDVAAQNVAAE